MRGRCRPGAGAGRVAGGRVARRRRSGPVRTGGPVASGGRLGRRVFFRAARGHGGGGGGSGGVARAGRVLEGRGDAGRGGGARRGVRAGGTRVRVAGRGPGVSRSGSGGAVGAPAGLSRRRGGRGAGVRRSAGVAARSGVPGSAGVGSGGFRRGGVGGVCGRGRGMCLGLGRLVVAGPRLPAPPLTSTMFPRSKRLPTCRTGGYRRWYASVAARQPSTRACLLSRVSRGAGWVAVSGRPWVWAWIGSRDVAQDAGGSVRPAAAGADQAGVVVEPQAVAPHAPALSPAWRRRPPRSRLRAGNFVRCPLLLPTGSSTGCRRSPARRRPPGAPWCTRCWSGSSTPRRPSAPRRGRRRWCRGSGTGCGRAGRRWASCSRTIRRASGWRSGCPRRSGSSSAGSRWRTRAGWSPPSGSCSWRSWTPGCGWRASSTASTSPRPARCGSSTTRPARRPGRSTRRARCSR
ncbi:hypothetical protein SVIOM74S_03780 [Streptomyces violarus]